MKARIFIAFVVAFALVLVFMTFKSDRKTVPVTEITGLDKQTIDVNDVIAYSENTDVVYRVKTTRDVLPGGFSAAMSPMLVDWKRSDLSEHGYLVIRNLNHGGNPVSGVTVLRTALIRPHLVKAVEYINVPLGGPEAISHGQIRFIFEDGGAEFVGSTKTVGEAETLGDLVLSWEAWRPPGVDFDIITGMDHRNFELTMRAYSGHQRFLEDALGPRDWNTYFLKLPGNTKGFAELLKVAMVLGDGAARHSIGRMLEQAEDEWATQGPEAAPGGTDALAQWRALKSRSADEKPPVDDSRVDMTGKTGYQSLIRSCATMALYSIDVAVARLIDAGVPHRGMRPTQTPNIENEPEWLAQLADADIAGIFARAPRTLKFVRANPTAIPGKIPGALNDAGLLVQENGKPKKRHYSMKSETPWGHRDHLLIR
ncbi:MAG: hypothetical protein JSW50_08980 [Candidatus Latescibacterota bacterium]|nr:MAG: hypothetical protein JSW50_08980 [Candidatus Latescibacterota bacterium]